jgi:hypothetical protein
MFKKMALTQLAIVAFKFRGESYSFFSQTANSEELTKQKKLNGSRNIVSLLRTTSFKGLSGLIP